MTEYVIELKQPKLPKAPTRQAGIAALQAQFKSLKKPVEAFVAQNPGKISILKEAWINATLLVEMNPALKRQVKALPGVLRVGRPITAELE